MDFFNEKSSWASIKTLQQNLTSVKYLFLGIMDQANQICVITSDSLARTIFKKIKTLPHRILVNFITP